MGAEFVPPLHDLPGTSPSTGDPAGETPPGGPLVLDVRDVTKTYGIDETAVHALRGVSLQVAPGEYVAVMGASGSGKSTLMNLLGCLDVPTSGRYLLDGMDVAALDDQSLALVRNRKIGFVFQSFNLVPRMSAQANVELPMAYARVAPRERHMRARAALDLVGLGDRGHHRPQQLSGGQQQRVAFARSLVMSPSLILADEPTGNLDSESTDEILVLLDRLNRDGRTVVVITHEDHVVAHARRRIEMRDGRVIADELTGNLVGATR